RHLRSERLKIRDQIVELPFRQLGGLSHAVNVSVVQQERAEGWCAAVVKVGSRSRQADERGGVGRVEIRLEGVQIAIAQRTAPMTSRAGELFRGEERFAAQSRVRIARKGCPRAVEAAEV